MDKQCTRDELIDALRKAGGHGTQIADMLSQEERLMPGDYFTHDRTGKRFLCRSVTHHNYDGMLNSVRVEIEPVP
jgi:hypothetical protein